MIGIACLALALRRRLAGWGKRMTRDFLAFAFPGFLLQGILLAGLLSWPLLAKDPAALPRGMVLPGVSADRPLKVVYPVVMPPYTFEDDRGEAQGLAVDLLRMWSEKTGIPLQFKSAAWGEGLQMMREGKADIHASLYLSEEREQYLTYAATVAPSQGMIFYHRSIFNISGLADLRAFKVGAVRNSYHEQYIRRQAPEASLISYAEFPDMLSAAQKGDIRVFVEDAGATLYRLKERGLLDEFRHNAGQALYRNNFWIAVHKGDTRLAKALAEGMALISPDERATLERKWLPVSFIRTPDTLFIAISDDNAPYSFVNAEGSPAGLLVDIWRLWAEKTGRKIEFLFSGWDEAVDNVRHGRADIHSGLFQSEYGAQWLDFSIPFHRTGSSLFYLRRPSSRYADRDLSGMRIGVLRGSYHEQYLRREHPGVRMIPFQGKEKMLRAVLSGDLSACLAEDSSANAVIQRLGLSGKFDVEPLLPFALTIHAAVPRGQASLLSLVNEGFQAITRDEMESLQQRWAMGSEKDSFRVLRKWFLAVVGAALALIGVFVLWNRSLSRKVKSGTAVLAESEERFRSTFEQAAVGIAHVSPDGRFLRVNGKFRHILGYSQEETLQRTFRDIVYADDLNMDLSGTERMLSGEIDAFSGEARYVRKDGSLVWVHQTMTLVRRESGQPRWFVLVIQDISDGKRDKEAFQQHQFRLASAIEVADLGFYEVIDGERVRFADSRALGLLGFPGAQNDEFGIFHFWGQHLHPEDGPRMLDLSRKLNEGALDRITAEYRFQHPQRGVIWIRHLAHVVDRNAAGWATRTVGVLQEITERKQAEEELLKNQRLLADMERLGNVGGWEIDLDTMKLRWTAEVRHIHEVDSTFEPTVESAIQFYAPASRPVIERFLRRAMEHGEAYDVELDIITAKGNLRVVHTIGKADLEHRRVYGFVHDITASKENEREMSRLRLELTHLSRVLTLNEISGSLAHEINQPLGAILNNAEAARNLMARTQDKPEEIPEIIEDIIQDAKRAGDVVRRLRTLVKRSDTRYEPLPIHALIDEVLGLLHNAIFLNNVTLRLEEKAESALVRGDRVRLQQVLLNLVTNAMDAMLKSPSRILTVRSAMDVPETVTVSVSDTGPGIDQAKPELLFRPFFTTKRDGLGLGLSICRSIIEEHGGRIWGENHPGGGATFSFSLKTWKEESV
ncbi:MAG: transporter substrate-binding domain-containing protein [Rubrivivax sp.]|nr:transporter substrate-binding domain-containing protein [Rubrivivax sp.]